MLKSKKINHKTTHKNFHFQNAPMHVYVGDHINARKKNK